VGNTVLRQRPHRSATPTSEASRTVPFWEFNLRFKTDSSRLGPATGTPVLVPAGMQGDRASVVFSSPAEIGRLIEERC